MWSPPALSDCGLNRTSETPLCRQVRSNLERKTRRGILRPYDRLPTVRRMAEAFRVGAGAIVQALSSMAQDEVIVCRQGSGSFVAPVRPHTTALCFPFGSLSRDDPPVEGLRAVQHVERHFQLGQQIIDGLRQGYDEDREIHIFGSTHDQSPGDMKICRIKNADPSRASGSFSKSNDGLVFHSVSEGMRNSMIELSERMPVVGQRFFLAPEVIVDCRGGSQR